MDMSSDVVHVIVETSYMDTSSDVAHVIAMYSWAIATCERGCPMEILVALATGRRLIFFPVLLW
jgi:cobalamin biosynthesis protein CbiG